MSARLGIADVVRWSGGTLLSGDAKGECRGVSIDSRRVEPGFAFFARRGSVQDGARFARAADRVRSRYSVDVLLLSDQAAVAA